MRSGFGWEKGRSAQGRQLGIRNFGIEKWALAESAKDAEIGINHRGLREHILFRPNRASQCYAGQEATAGQEGGRAPLAPIRN